LIFAAVLFLAFTHGIAFLNPPFGKGGRGGICGRARAVPGFLNPPQSPFVKGGGEKCYRRGRPTVLAAPLRRSEALTNKPPVLPVAADWSIFSKKIKSIESLYFTYHKRIYS
jgi:hypothetical protein